VQPHGDPELRRLRPRLALVPGGAGGLIDLDGFHGLHPALAGLEPLYRRGELGFVHAVAGGYRERSHFDGQDALENGTASALGARDGWLNRALAGLAGRSDDFAMTIGRERMLLLSGAEATGAWSPDSQMVLEEANLPFLEQLYRDDALFAEALAGALAAAAKAGMAGGPGRRRVRGRQLASLAASFLAAPDGARIAAFSLTGWDTHRAQQVQLGPALNELEATILALAEGLGPAWAETAVLAVTEFGRTAHENGTQGTDHGTASVAMLAGGRIRGGRVFGRWPGLGPEALYEGRDLMPTDDWRRHAGWLLAALFGVPKTHLETAVFPGLAMGADPGLVRL
jgi:uncharacterized protein (DUF1501 family)